MEYTVAHERVAIAAEDAVFGNVAVTWQGTPMVNLFMSTLNFENTTSSNFTDLTFRIYTGNETFLLNERREIVGSPYFLPYSASYDARMTVPEGQEPTQQQRQTYWHQREYTVPVFNRRQRIVLSYLTTVPDGTITPSLWVGTQQEGADVRYRPNVPLVFGVPVVWATWLGFACGVAVVAVAIWAELARPLVAIIALFSGLTTQAIGSGAYRLGRFLYRIILH